jgi:hypothetical protein
MWVAVANVFSLSLRYLDHKLAGLPFPTDDERVRPTVRGIRRTLGVAPARKAPATADKVLVIGGSRRRRLAENSDKSVSRKPNRASMPDEKTSNRLPFCRRASACHPASG